MIYTKEQLIEIARAAAVEHKIDPALFCALCERESNWQWDAVRYEPAFYSRYIVPQNLLSQTEAQMRAISWGLGQIMGQTARDFGYRGLNLSGLLDPVEGAIRCRQAGGVPKEPYRRKRRTSGIQRWQQYRLP